MSHTPTETKRRAERLTRRARRHMMWETYAPVMALAVAFIALFIIGSSFGIWERIGDPWRLIVLLAALSLTVMAIIKARALRRPSISAARRRVEGDADLAHRPLDVIMDSPALGAESDPLWQTHQARALRAAEKAAPTRMRPALGRIDKYYLRFIVPVLLVIAIVHGLGDNRERLWASLTPGWIKGVNGADAKFDAWLDPPQYTGRPPLYFKTTNSVKTPEGSELVARISGVARAPRLSITENGRTRRVALTRLGPKSFEARTRINADAKARWRIGNTRQVWTMDILKDKAPTINYDSVPQPGKRDTLEFTYSMDDDYGVENLYLQMTRISDDALPENERAVETADVPMAGAQVKSAKEQPASLSLIKHPWAGQEVRGRLIAKDGKGQRGQTEETVFIVPDKIFVEPIAKAVAEHRQLVMQGQNQAYAHRPEAQDIADDDKPLFAYHDPAYHIDRAPEPLQRAALLMGAVADAPVGAFQDPVVYMGLVHSQRRIQYAEDTDDLTGLDEDLWKLALRAEYGVIGTALEEMRQAQKALARAMARGAPQREIDVLFDRYNEAVDAYMEELRRQAILEGRVSDGGDNEGGEGGRNADQIQELMDAIEEANRIGDTEAARKALAQLNELLENMQMELNRGGGGGDGEPMDEEMSEEMKEALEDLADLLGEQRELQDETQSAERQGEQSGQQSGEQPGEQQGQQSGQNQGQSQGQNEGQNSGQQNGNDRNGAQSGEELADMQRRLRDTLEALRENAPAGMEDGDAGSGGNEDEDGETGGGGETVEEALERALRAMGDSEDALGDEDFFVAQEAQREAIDALRRAGQGIIDAARDEQDGESAQGGDGTNEDPFGRGAGAVDGDGDASLEDEEVIDDIERAERLIDELRRRAGERNRNQTERDYLERLLDRF